MVAWSQCRGMLWGIAFLVSTSQVKAQYNVYHPFPDSNAVWGMTSGCMDGQFGSSAYIQNYYLGDTLIDDRPYKHIDEIYVITSSSGGCYPPSGLGSGYLWDDAINRKVYWRSEFSNQDTLLYDFTLTLGDTFVSCINSCNMLWLVQSIDSILIGSNYRKRINFDQSESCASFSIIEGIGSTHGLTMCPYIPFEMGSILRCVNVDDSLLYNAALCPDLSPCGDLTSDVADIFQDLSNRVEIAQNPTSWFLRLDCDASLLPMEFSILDLTGKLIFRKEVIDVSTSISISSLARGVYLLRVQRNGALVVHKKIIKL
ncbi:MAG TPA: T9SS type A sorting domain-containing protein [Flavobacteriales bacterium]|nr:T9SS type A sorting domain-containing protein [Flavobacteriales bacterium]